MALSRIGGNFFTGICKNLIELHNSVSRLGAFIKCVSIYRSCITGKYHSKGWGGDSSIFPGFDGKSAKQNPASAA